MNLEQETKLYTLLLLKEVEALRSVLSELPGDKSEYSQMHVANAMEEVRNYLKPFQKEAIEQFSKQLFPGWPVTNKEAGI